MQPNAYINPLTFIIEQIRLVVISGESPDWSGLGVYTIVNIVIKWVRLLLVPENKKRVR